MYVDVCWHVLAYVPYLPTTVQSLQTLEYLHVVSSI